MKIRFHLPRESEAKLSPALKQDLDIHPRFYKKAGFTPFIYFTTVDAKGNEEPYVMLVNAASKAIRVEKLVEVIPACDEDNPTPEDNSNDAREVNE